LWRVRSKMATVVWPYKKNGHNTDI
jgi:hypothetical protein